MCLWVIRCTFPLHVTSFVEFTGWSYIKTRPIIISLLQQNKNLIGYILVHVEDFLFTGIQQFHKTIISKLRKTFQVVKENKLDFEYIGLNLKPTYL